MTVLMNGKALEQKILEQAKIKVIELKKKNIVPVLKVIQVGNDAGSNSYIARKIKSAALVGIDSEHIKLPETVSEKKLLELIDSLNKNKKVHGILLQLPLPKKMKIPDLMELIIPEKDVDGFHPINQGRILLGEKAFISCTPQGIMRLFEEYKIDLTGKNIVMVGRSNIVGKPMTSLLINASATVTVCNTKTKNLAEHTKKADIVIVAAGSPKLLKAEMVKKNVIVIDVGMNKVEGKLCGDVDFEAVKKKSSYITPVPGGVGRLTTACLMLNTIKAAEMQEKK
ncbi:MAG: bifunctional 5,10-methylenetetrahydrofolate dehydrogenase/5,10-methenyltetrahydrofolate cyclohydrolase [Candidatus Diapherotrites archaeon]|nr:bifunctional 5,10-methylenetetrahydrofolate dehydrogenase/5,10-methenyltetrahydrofolate cyclohydrolase [Candidatus Diapherotrites archaeon]